MILTVTTLALAVAVLLGAGCRLIHMNLRSHKVLWQAMFVFMGWGAIATIGEVSQGRVTWPAIFLLAAFALYLWGSRESWQAGPPEFMKKGG